jgi:inosine-uridine nucleoside N-ribohydrolase
MKRLWIDCDTGFDDLVALAVAQQTPGYEIVGISTVVGNTTLANTTANTLAAVEALGITAPVYVGAAKPLAQEPQTIEGLLGGGAMGTVGRAFPAACQRQPEERDAVTALLAELGRGPATILATGPLTNLAMALNLRPEAAAAVERIVFMGGSATNGNHTAAAEFNAFADPEAFDVVLRAGVDVAMFGLNLTRQVLITTAEEEALRALGAPLGDILADHVGFYLRMIDKTTPKPMALHDPSAAAFLVWPELFRLEDALVRVELHGQHARGATICEFRVPRKGMPNAKVATAAEGPEVMRRVLAVLVRAATAGLPPAP